MVRGRERDKETERKRTREREREKETKRERAAERKRETEKGMKETQRDRERVTERKKGTRKQYHAMNPNTRFSLEGRGSYRDILSLLVMNHEYSCWP